MDTKRQPAPKKALASSPTAVAETQPLPAWFRRFIELYGSGMAHGFIVSGDVWGATTRNTSYRAYLQAALATSREIVVIYNLAGGIRFPLPSMRDKALKLLTTNEGREPARPAAPDPFQAALAAAGVPRLTTLQRPGQVDLFASAETPAEALVLLEQLLKHRDARSKVALVVESAELLCPQTSKSIMSPADRQVLARLLMWGQDGELAGNDNPLFLLTRSVGELHEDVRATGSGYQLLDIALPTRQEREEYLTWYLQERSKRGEPITLERLSVETLAVLTAGLNIPNLENLLLLGMREGKVTPELAKARKDDIIRAEYSELAEMIEPLDGGFAALGGMDYLVNWAERELITPLRAGSSDAPKGVLLVGPPGTGKTMFVRAMAGAAGFNAVALRPENILGRYVGQSEAALKRFLAFVRALTPVIIFFDEVDQSDMAQRGNGSGNPVASNLFNQLLQFLSDETLRGKLVMCFASNRPDLLDSALKRSGRMDFIIPLLLPEADARESILRAQARTQGVSLTETALLLFVAQSEKLSAADLAALVAKAKQLAAREGRSQIREADAKLALRYQRSETPQTADRYTRLAIAACTDLELLPPKYVQWFEQQQQEVSDAPSDASSASEGEQVNDVGASPFRRGRDSW